MNPVVETWHCSACSSKETTGGALPRGWRYMRRKPSIVPVCTMCITRAQKAADEAAERALWGMPSEPGGGW